MGATADRVGRWAVAAVVAVLVPAACGVPGDGRARTLDPTQVPYVLSSPAGSPAGSPAPATSATTPAATDGTRVYFVDADLRLVPVAGDAEDSAAGLLRRLVTGPSDAERAAGLQTTIGAEVALELTSLDAGLAVVDVTDLAQGLSADRLPLAVGQIVLTLTSAPGVDAVRLQRRGADREVPLPGGALTGAELTAADYASLTAAPAP